MAPQQTCPSCSEPLADDAPRGMCPACLLKAGFGSVSDATISLAAPAAASPEPPPSPAELAPHFPQFQILRLLGQGGMGMVYQARQTNLDRPVALKILSASHARAAEFSQRFEREAKALARLNHPGIVSVYDFGQAGPFYFFTMEYVDGRSLADLQRTRRPTVAETFSIMDQLCNALEFAHASGWVHRDLKPANILIDGNGNAKLGDFGLAKLLGQPGGNPRLTLTGVRMGTPKYMAPEQMDEPESVDHRADLYALGVVFYEMLTGEVPVGRFAAPSRTAGVRRDLDAVVYKLLERDPARRYQQAAEVGADLTKIVRSVQGAGPRRSRSHWVVLATSVALIGAGLAGWRMFEGRTRAKPAATTGAVARSPVPGWFLEGRSAGEFAAGVDRQVLNQAKPSLYLKNTNPTDGAAALVQAIRSDNYRGQRIRFAGQLRSRDMVGRAGLCLRIDYFGVVQSEDMERLDIEGTAEWKECAVVLDVPAGSDRITFGVQLTGRGEVWLNDLKFDVVGREVPTTGRIVNTGLPGSPQFDFDR